MEQEKEQLPGIILRDLYRNTLADIRGTDAVSLPEKTPADTPHSLGGNRKHVLILVSYPALATIAEGDLSFLLNILNACRLGLQDVRILNLAHVEEPGYAALAQAHAPETVLLFGLSPADIGMPVHFPDNQVQRFAEMRFLSAPALGRLQTDDAAKRLLWAGLKQLFLN